MRCASCNERLSDFEATRKSKFTHEYLDLCNWCFGTINDQILTEERHDLEHESDSFSQEFDDSLDNEQQ